ncbi:hypothetical protein SFRURICE_004015 [Spodoptera frugiperda]|nr:hypothetical protein SFRURICE_004015 [Spodoptera frugiperda]
MGLITQMVKSECKLYSGITCRNTPCRIRIRITKKFSKNRKSPGILVQSGIEPETPCPAVSLATTRLTRQSTHLHLQLFDHAEVHLKITARKATVQCIPTFYNLCYKPHVSPLRTIPDSVLTENISKIRKISGNVLPDLEIEPETPCPAAALTTIRPTRQRGRQIYIFHLEKIGQLRKFLLSLFIIS